MKESRLYNIVIAAAVAVVVLLVLFSTFALELRDNTAAANRTIEVTAEQFWRPFSG